MKARLLCLVAGFIILGACETAPRDRSFDNLTMLPPVTPADIPADIHSDSWARLPAVQRAGLSAEVRETYDMLTSPGNGYEDGLRGYYNFVAMTLKAFDVQRAPGSELMMPVSQ